MDCTIKLSISYVLKKFIENIIEDINKWHETAYSEEMLLLSQLEEKLQIQEICEKQCMGCLDYILVSKMFLNFRTKIDESNKKYVELIYYILRKMDLKNLNGSIEIAINVISNPQYIKKQLKENQIDKYQEYCDEINGIIIGLKLAYYNQRITELHDVILNHSYLKEEQKFNAILFNIDSEIETFYIDQNFIGKYINDNSFQRQIDNIKKKAKYQFVFSPYLIEDGIKMNQVFLKEYFENIDLLTDGISVTRYDDKLTYVKEEVDSIVERILLWLQPTKAGENLKFYWSLYNKYAYPDFKRDEKNTLVQNINNDIQLFLKEFDIESVHNEKNEYERTMEKTLYWYMVKKSYPFRIEDLQNGYIKINNDFDCIEKIDKLCDFLDFINYETDKEEKKIKSSYQDTEHLKHAWKCKYFVTDDKKLIKRGEFIYSLLNIKTQFITSKNFNTMMYSFHQN
ncbi:MAG TPA: hypothetical protein ENK66_07530 [Arcobacter sp.]|nr:hypothetical protein [Arcobacter sp.]